jgi:uncharacterized protein YeaO (DUF488 family)
MSTHKVQVRRVYDEPDAGDGVRVLVDRLWPRGVAKDRARLHEWCKEIARRPSCAGGTHTLRNASQNSAAATSSS